MAARERGSSEAVGKVGEDEWEVEHPDGMWDRVADAYDIICRACSQRFKMQNGHYQGKKCPSPETPDGTLAYPTLKKDEEDG